MYQIFYAIAQQRLYSNIKNYYIADNRMRGIQINNYFNNHITLNGKKLNNEVQSLPQSHRPKVIQHPGAIQEHSKPNLLEEVGEGRSPQLKSHPVPLKKRTNTLVQLKKHLPQKRSISVQRVRNALSSKKKEDILSDSQQKQQENLINVSQKKLKQSSSKGGLGKRSKSTIIKATHPQALKEFPKKQSKKLNSNHTNESAKPPKTKRKKSAKVPDVKQNKLTITSKASTVKKDTAPQTSRQLTKREKFSLKIDKNIKIQKSDKKSARNTSKMLIKQPSKPAKPISARQKKGKKSRFIEQLKEKYENQTILEGSGNTSRLNIAKQQGADQQFLTVMSNLQKMLTSGGSKQKLKKQIELLNLKLKQFNIETEQDEEEQDQQQDIKEQQKFEKNLSGKGRHIIRSLQNDFHEQEQAHERIKLENIENSQSEDEQPLHRKLQEEGIFVEEEEDNRNPLIGKRATIFPVADAEDEQQIDDRRRQIELLKKFKNQSTKMMQKVGINNKVNTQKLQIQQVRQPRQQKKLTIDNISGFSNNTVNSYNWQDKYPNSSIKSPKFDESQLMGAISMKQQFLSSKHDKMSELVKKMFEKQLVSPRSFEFQMKSINRKYQEENIALESIKKQAQQLSTMLSQIKKDKEEIQGIDELIRNQRWQDAEKLVKKAQPLSRISQLDEYEKKWQKSNQQHLKKFQKPSWQRQGGWQRVKIKKSEVENNQFVEIGQMTNRGRRNAQIDIDQQCGGTQQSQQLQANQIRLQKEEQQYFYYNEQNDDGKDLESSGLIRLVQIPSQPEDGRAKTENEQVFHISDDNTASKEGESSIQKNNSQLSSRSPFERDGFTTNLYFIKEYCIAICEFVRDNQIFKSQFRNNVSKPLQFSLMNLLKEIRSHQNLNYGYLKRTNKSAIAEIIWNEFNNQYEVLKYNSTSSKETEKFFVQKQLQGIFVRMVYDVLNESLDYERPGGQFGRAFPWRQTARHLKNLKQLAKSQEDNVEAYDLMFGVAIARIIQWGSCLCGFLPDTVELQNTQIDEAYVNQIRQTRTAFLLQKMMAEEEVTMSNFQLQQAYIQFHLGEIIYKELMQQAQTQIFRLE